MKKKFNINLYKKYAWLAWIYCVKHFNNPYKFYIFLFIDTAPKYGSTTVLKYEDICKEDQAKDSLEIPVIRIDLENHFLYQDKPIKSLVGTILDEYAHTLFVTNEQAKEGELAKHEARIISYFIENEYKKCVQWVRKNWKKYKVNEDDNLEMA